MVQRRQELMPRQASTARLQLKLWLLSDSTASFSSRHEVRGSSLAARVAGELPRGGWWIASQRE